MMQKVNSEEKDSENNANWGKCNCAVRISKSLFSIVNNTNGLRCRSLTRRKIYFAHYTPILFFTDYAPSNHVRHIVSIATSDRKSVV